MAASIPKPLPVPTLETRAYWEGCKQHELRIQQCAACGQHQFYPRLYCSKCFSDRVEWVKASGRAKVMTFTIVRRPVSPAFADDVPYVVALVALDEGPTMMTNIVGIAPEKVEIGMPVAVTFDDWTEEISIPKFTPALG
jgi:uncharacterized OB-fold protein